MNFTFEHDCDNATMTVEITVSCEVSTHDGTYDTPPECYITNLDYTIKCGEMDLTSLIINNMYGSKLYWEIDSAVEDEIWKEYENN